MLKSVETSRETAPALPWPNPPAATPQVEEGPSGQEHALKDIQESGALPDPRVQQSTIAAGITGESSTVADFYLILFIGVLGIIGFLARGIVAIAARRRRRTHFAIVDSTNFHLELTAPGSGTDLPPPQPMDLIHQQDDIEQALRQLSRAWKQRAA